MQIFVAVLENESNPNNEAKDQLLENEVAKNREEPSIIKYILLCGRHSPLLRGHR